MKIDIYQAIEMLAASWQGRKTDIIGNCFNKAQIMNDAQVRDGDSEEEPSSTPDVAEVWGTLRTNGAVPDDLQLRDFL